MSDCGLFSDSFWVNEKAAPVDASAAFLFIQDGSNNS